MTIPSKGSRRVRMGDIEYAWRIRKKPTYSQGAFQTPLRVAIQSCAEGPRSVLVVNLQVSRPDNWTGPHQTGVKPAMIRDMIARGLAQGWTPTTAGGPFTLDYPLILDRP